jgi:hypothetical protein
LKVSETWAANKNFEKSFKNLIFALNSFQIKIVMSEIHLIIQDDYIQAFLELIQKMPQIRVQGVKPTVPKSKNQRLLEQLPLNDPLRKAIRARPRPPKTLEQIMQLQNYQKTNWVRLREVANAMDIQEPIELLLEQLKS